MVILSCVRGLSFHFFNVFLLEKNVYLHKKYICTSGLWIYGYSKICIEHLSFCTMQQCSWGLKQMALCEGYVCCNMFAMFIRCQSNLLTEMRERESGDDCFLFLAVHVYILLVFMSTNIEQF